MAYTTNPDGVDYRIKVKANKKETACQSAGNLTAQDNRREQANRQLRSS